MIDRAKLLVGIPKGLLDPLFESYQEIARNFQEHRWEPSELNGGKFCEIVYCILSGTLNGSYPSKPSKPQNMVDACRALENSSNSGGLSAARSLRILIPRMLQPLYEVRNNRGVGHAGGDVDPNYMDAVAVFGMASWILAELIRVFHAVDTKEAQDTVSALVERKHPMVWEIEGQKRVLNPSMPKRNQTLLLLYHTISWASEADLVSWVEYSSASMFKNRILEPLHDARLIEHDKLGARARLSPLGAKFVEQNLIPTIPH
jgi:hypothetical protein